MVLISEINAEGADSPDEKMDNSIREDDIRSNPGWADAMAKVLRSKKPKRSRTIILSKAKKISNSKNVKVEEEETDSKQDTSNKSEVGTRQKQKELKSKYRVKPSILDRERERRLNRIATKGVVQLFNAVRDQQKSLESQLKEVGGSERKREKVMKSLDKRSFLNVLMGTARSEPVDSPTNTKGEDSFNKQEDQNQSWQILRDDYMMETANLKDWDKKERPA